MTFEQFKQDSERIPQYEDDFGHVAEAIIREAIADKAGIVIEKVEKGSRFEDNIKKIDFWIKFKYMEEPLATQYTCS